MSGDWKHKGGHERGDGASGGKAEAIGSRAPGNKGGKRDGEELEQERKLRLGRGCAKAGKEKRACAEPVPGLAGKVEYVARAARERAGEGGADEGKDDCRDGDDGQIAKEGLRGGA